jgi:two-component system chemotaxis sensor kinase CheA
MSGELDEFDEIIKEFLMECNELLDLLDNDFVAIEQNASDKKILSGIFRSIHSIKGGAGMLAFKHLEKLSHAAENLLSLLREDTLQLTTEMITVLLNTVDAIRVMLQAITETGQDGTDDYAALINRLTELQNTDEVEKAEVNAFEDNIELFEILNELEAQPDLDAITEPAVTEEKRVVDTKSISLTETTVRIDVSLLDKLMNLVGELVLSRNQILQVGLTLSDPNFLTISQRLNLITSELQEGVMKTRMQPIGNVWAKFTRIVRDLATTCNKKVCLEMLGTETELDKTLIEAIKDPRTHIIRNSVDHGIETREVRRNSGKPEEGTLILKAYHEGGHVNIEIHDDGAGISADKVKAKALERGLISADQAARMSERDALNLIFLPGLSTAENVTNVSGRGVGMDVVRTNIERISGTIDIQSQVGSYTILKIKIPLTLAIIPALLISCQGNRYAIPQISLLELVRIEPEDAINHIQFIKETPVFKLRGKLLPLVYLNQELELDKIEDIDSISIVVVHAAEIQFGLVVDQINDTQEIVVKPLSKLLKNQSVFAGATIMGDGKISLILDITGLARKAGLLSSTMQMNKVQKHSLSHDHENTRQAYLLLRAGKEQLMAVPLSQVDRIEEFYKCNIEQVGDLEVVQYRDSIMPLVHLGTCINHQEMKSNEDEKIQVIVHHDHSSNFGFIVDYVHDIVEGTFEINPQIKRHGVLGTSVIESKATEVLDMESIIQRALPDYLEHRTL